jgi:hypothetical protein
VIGDRNDRTGLRALAFGRTDTTTAPDTCSNDTSSTTERVNPQARSHTLDCRTPLCLHGSSRQTARNLRSKRGAPADAPLNHPRKQQESDITAPAESGRRA